MHHQSENIPGNSMRLAVQLTAAVLLLTAVQSKNISQKDIEDIAHHLANPSKTHESILKKFTVDMDDQEELQRVLDKILTVRVAGSPEIEKVGQFIMEEMKALEWDVSTNKFEEDTGLEGIGTKTFTNIIATLNPDAPRRLIIACHYDSKMTPKGFLGAIDSAVPCSQMINLAAVMKKDLDAHNKSELGKKLTLQFVFFDGEEPFIQWVGNDNTYGSRHLAKKWEEGGNLKGIEALMLLDLLGAKNPIMIPIDAKPHAWWKKLVEYESLVVNQKSGEGAPLPKEQIFQDLQPYNHGIADDHVPFMQRGVPILHLIATAPGGVFPPVWHTLNDNIEAIDWPTVTKLNHINRMFVAHYLELFKNTH